MSNVLSEEKKQQVIALDCSVGLYRIEQATGVRRESQSPILKQPTSRYEHRADGDGEAQQHQPVS